MYEDFIESNSAESLIYKFCDERCIHKIMTSRRRHDCAILHPCSTLKRLSLFRLFYMAKIHMPSIKDGIIYLLTDKELFSLQFEYTFLTAMYKKHIEELIKCGRIFGKSKSI